MLPVDDRFDGIGYHTSSQDAGPANPWHVANYSREIRG